MPFERKKQSRFFWVMITLLVIAFLTNPSKEDHEARLGSGAVLYVNSYEHTATYNSLGILSTYKVDGEVRTFGVFDLVFVLSPN